MKGFFDKFDLELIEEVISQFETLEEAYDHLNEFYELKCFEVIGDYGEEDNEGEDDVEENSEEEWEEVKGNAHGKRSGKKPSKPKTEINFNENNIFKVKEQGGDESEE